MESKRIAVVTGGASGLGLQVIRQLIMQGFKSLRVHQIPLGDL